VNQGRRANETGNAAERAVYDMLVGKKYRVKKQVVVGTNEYEGTIKVDFFVSGIPGYENGLIIEVKWQAEPGSVDEKFPYLVMNIKKHYPCPAMVVIGGGGCRAGAERYLRAQVGGRLIKVFNLEEFLKWTMSLPDGDVSYFAQGGLFE
jgi:hypothetical protein